MKKLALNVEQLRVDSYETTTGNTGENGTVWGNQIQPRTTNTTRTMDFTCGGSTCGTPTNAASCVMPERAEAQ